jgi:HlyD family secretion protein
MLLRWIKRGLLGLLLVGILGLFAWMLWPQPIGVDVAKVVRGSLRVTVEEEGINRIRDVFVVSAPVAGRVERLPGHVADRVIANETIVAVIRPADPAFLDVRTRREREAAVAAARAAVALAEAEAARANSSFLYYEGELKRAQKLAPRGIVSERDVERASLDHETARAQIDSSEAQLELRKRELEAAEARLLEPGQNTSESTLVERCCIAIRAPVNGTILRVPTESEQIVQAGSTLVEIGNLHDSEIAVDLLSTDAVKVVQGAEAQVTGWGLPKALSARVVRVDPAGFTKVSALGIEEQRVTTILDIVNPPSDWTRLGHGYRVYVQITVFLNDNALLVPLSALFREGTSWAAYRIDDGVARLIHLSIEHRNSASAEVLAGLIEGDRVILHPSDRITDGSRVALRQ